MEVATLGHKKTVIFLLKCFSNQIKRYMDGSLTGMQFGVIKFIDSHEGKQDIFQKDIELEFNIRRSTATGILQLMEQKDLIIREGVSYDARLKKLVTTAHGKQLKQDFIEKFEALEKKIKMDISDEEIETFLKIVNKMSDNLERE